MWWSHRAARAVLGHLIAAAVLLPTGSGGVVCGQSLPVGPLVFADGAVTVGADASVSVGPVDPGFYNYTDYDRSTLRLAQIDVLTSVRAGRRLTVLGQVRSQNVGSVDIFALYLRVRPWVNRRIDVQVGRVPPTFGAFPRRAYGRDNPLIGLPLAFQYLTSLRSDAVPANADQLLRMRGRGWLSSFSIGNSVAAHGMPLASAFRWENGVQLHAENEWFEGTASLSGGSVSSPMLRLTGGPRQVVGRVAARPVAGLIVGVSAARGSYLTDTVLDALPQGIGRADLSQSLWGADLEYSRGYYQLRAELVHSRWRLPVVQSPMIDRPLSSLGAMVEVRYAIRPGLHAAARVDRLGFSDIEGSGGLASWEAPVTRIEVGGGYLLQRNLQLKIAVQHNRRDTDRSARFTAGAAQLMFWF
ncbi:MAG: hypothetical protein AB7Q29_07820 [Vicinamibacterales bacterium]